MIFDYKFVFIAVLFAVLVTVKLLAGSKPYGQPVRRRRRFGFRGSHSPLREAEQAESKAQVQCGQESSNRVAGPRSAGSQSSSQPAPLSALPAPDPEKDFFQED